MAGGLMRLLLALSVAGALAACGNGSGGGPGAEGAAQPSASPPAVSGNGPPLAWAEVVPESGAGGLAGPVQRVWMAFSSYCWGHTCADYAQPSERTDIPVVRASLGSKVVFHLGFDPTSAGLQIPTGGEPLKLTGSGPQRTWIVDRSALLVLNATDAADEQASYAINVTLGDPEPGSGSDTHSEPGSEPEHGAGSEAGSG